MHRDQNQVVRFGWKRGFDKASGIPTFPTHGFLRRLEHNDNVIARSTVQGKNVGRQISFGQVDD